MNDELRQQIAAARDAAYGTLGRLQEDALTFALPAAFTGGHEWPSHRQYWRVIHRPGTTLLISDGLSDPFADQEGPSRGYGLECLIETDEPLERVSASWPFHVLIEVCQTAVNHGGLRPLLAELKLVSLEVSGEGMPAPLVTEDGCVGVMLGVPSSTLPSLLQTPAGDVQLITTKVLLASELEYIRQQGAQGRLELARRFSETGQEHLSRAHRSPVL